MSSFALPVSPYTLLYWINYEAFLISERDTINIDFASKVWAAEREARDAACDEKYRQVFRVVALYLTDFWLMFRVNHERSYWMERMVPLFM